MSLEKAVIVDTVRGERFAVLFNPEEYTLQRENSYAQVAVPGLSAPLLQFSHGQQQTLEMELFLDTHEAHHQGNRLIAAAGDDVRGLVQRITSLMDIVPATHAPPVLVFSWGSLAFTGVLTRVTQKYVMFRPDGIPVRARLTVSFGQYANAEAEARSVKRETADYHRTHVVRAGERLSTIAGAVYGDPTLWRAIALRNGIGDPRRLETGQRLLLPRLPYVDPDSGVTVA